MTRLVSGKVLKTDSANVSADRYQFIEISEAEPDLGLPSAFGQVFTSDLNGNRYWINLDTANINESSNLYYTNSRVLAHLAESDVSVLDLTVVGNLIVQGDTTTLNTATLVVEDKNIIIANGAPDAATADGAGITIDGAQANITYNSSSDTFDINKTIHVKSVSLYGGYGVGSPSIGGLGYDGANIVFLSAETGVKINTGSPEGGPIWEFDTSGDLTVPNYIIFEGGTVIGDETGGSPQQFRVISPLGYGISLETDSNIAGNNYSWIFGADGNLTAPKAVNAESISANIWSGIYTSNVIEDTNLYYTNARVLAHLAESNANVQNFTIDKNLIVRGDTNVVDLYSSNIYTQTITMGVGGSINGQGANIGNFASISAVDFNGDLTGNVTGTVSSLSNHTTSNLVEGNNLYYTNTRVLAHLATSDVETLDLTVSGNLVVVGNLSYLQVQNLEIEDNMVYLNANSNVSNPDLGWSGNYNDGTYAHAGIFRDASDGIFKIFEGYTPEPDESPFIDTGHESFRFANVQAERFIGTISTLSNHTTSNLAEGVNLYYTNARVDAYINSFIDTDDISEANNLYYTNARVISAVTPLLTTANVIELDSNLYYTNARVLSYVETLSIKDLRDVSNIYEANVGGLIGIQTGQALVWDGNVNQFVPVFVNSEVANVADLAVRVLSLEQFTTANIAEASSNLYFTNTRVLEALVDSNVIVNNLLVSGDLTVQGNAVTLNVAELVVEDKNITLANGAANALLADNSGITISGANATILYKESGDKFEINKNLDVTGNIVAGTGVGGSITGANLIATDTLEVNLIRSDDITSNAITIINSATFANVLVEADLVGNLTGTADFVATLSNFTTDDLAEGTNLYYTNSRVLAHLAESDVTVQGLTVQGDLTVQGNTTTLNVSELIVEDKNILLANGAPSAAAADGAGITVDGANAEILYVNATDSWNFNKELRANLTGNVTGFVSTISNFTTDDLAESNNLYYTNTRVLSVVTPLLTTANVIELDSNLYYTNARVFANVSEMSINVLADVDITGILNGQILAWDGSKFIPGAADVALFSESANVANVATTVTSLSNFTTDDLNEGSANLYFTERRAIDSFTAGRNILILENGTISSTAYSDLYSLDIDGAINYNITDSLEPGITFPGNADTNRFGLRSFTVTNISDDTAYIDANVLYYETGNSATLANKIPIPVGGYLEFINKTQIFQPNDKINLQAFDASLTPANNILSAIFTYETLVDDIAFIGTGVTLDSANANVVVYESSQSYTILESIKLVNNVDHIVRAKVFWADANSELKSYFVYNLPLPPNSSVEILQKPKRINFTDKILASYSPNSAVSVFVSGRSGTIYDLQSYTESYNVSSNSSIYLSFATTADEGTTLYYTVE